MLFSLLSRTRAGSSPWLGRRDKRIRISQILFIIIMIVILRRTHQRIPIFQWNTVLGLLSFKLRQYHHLFQLVSFVLYSSGLDVATTTTSPFYYSILNTQLSIARNTFNFGKVPFLVAERTYRSCFEPSLNTIQMKDVTTIAKGDAETIVIGRWGISLIFNGWLIQGVTTNGALVRWFRNERYG